MAATNGVLALITNPGLRNDVDRVAAAAGVAVIHAADPSSRRVWSGATAVVLDTAAAHRCAERRLPRRSHVVLVGGAEPRAADWQAAIAAGAQQVVALPAEEQELVTALSDAAEAVRDSGPRGAVVAVIGGRGGAGASLFAAALAHTAPEALLVDADPWGGGIDLVVGSEEHAGLRWPDLVLQGGRLSYTALRDALPVAHGTSVLSSGRTGTEIDPAALSAVVDAACRSGAAVICDLPRRSTAVVEAVLEAAALVVMVTPADVRSCAAAAAIAPWVTSANPNAGLVVRGPAPGGLRSGEVAGIVGLPLLAGMRPQPAVEDALERRGLRLRRRSPLAIAARRVWSVLQQHPVKEAS